MYKTIIQYGIFVTSGKHSIDAAFNDNWPITDQNNYYNLECITFNGFYSFKPTSFAWKLKSTHAFSLFSLHQCNDEIGGVFWVFGYSIDLYLSMLNT